MCLIGCLAELLCCAAEEVEEIDQIDTIVEELEESESGVGKVKQFFGIVSEKEDAANQGIDSEEFAADQNDRGISANVNHVLDMTIQRNPYVNVARNTFGVIRDYREGESVSDIVKQRTTETIKDQIPALKPQHIGAEILLKDGSE